MYNMFKKIQGVAEQIGAIREVKVFTNNEYFGNTIEIIGEDESGNEFKMELSVKVKEAGDDRI